MSWTVSACWRIFAQKKGYPCMVYSLYFHIDGLIHQFFSLRIASVTFHCITVYNNYHHLYIGSTTVLSDTYTDDWDG